MTIRQQFNQLANAENEAWRAYYANPTSENFQLWIEAFNRTKSFYLNNREQYKQEIKAARAG